MRELRHNKLISLRIPQEVHLELANIATLKSANISAIIREGIQKEIGAYIHLKTETKTALELVKGSIAQHDCHKKSDKEKVINQVKTNFDNWNKSAGLSRGDLSCLFAVTITPKESFLKAPGNGLSQLHKRERFVEDLVTTLQKKANSHLIRRPWQKKNKHLLIESSNVIESKDRYGDDCMHHSHSTWAIHPQLVHKFTSELVNEKLLNNSRVTVNGESIFLGSIIKDVKIKQIYDFEGWLEYQYKRIEDQRENNRWFGF
jgi:predicted DNA-binding protein